jgi:sugar fermentation stimulation protein A
LIEGRLLRRYKRFLVDVEMPGGETLTAHCPNTGAMTGCAEPGRPVWLSVSDSPSRKYPHTWELVDTGAGIACVHSALANRVVAEAVGAGRVPELDGYGDLQTEVAYGRGSRADMVLAGSGPRCVVEIKSVTLRQPDGSGAFPDAVSERARKHLDELRAVADSGERAVIFFCAFHTGIERVRPAREIDPRYAQALEQAVAGGVEAIAWSADVTPGGIELSGPLPVESH